MDIPEIRSIVGRFLNQSDLAKAARVCKNWNASFTPALFSTIEWDSCGRQPTTDALVANADHIRKVKVSGGPIDVFLDNCTKLRSISISSSRSWSQLSSLLQRNPYIHEISVYDSEEKPPREFMEAISSSPHLRELCIIMSKLDPTCVEIVLDTAVHLERLSVGGFGFALPRSFEKWPCFPSLKALEMDFYYNASISIQVEIIRRCPQLRELAWKLSDKGPYPPDVYDLFKTYCPYIDKLYLRGYYLSDEDLSRILDNCRGLTIFHICYGFGELAFRSLTRHFQSLQDLRLDSRGETGDMMHKIVTNCPNLTSFRGTTMNARDILGILEDEETGDETTLHQQPQDWICTNLRCLDVFICGLEGKPQDWHRRVFQQLSKLSKLDTLRVDARCSKKNRDGLDLRLETGLDALSSLRRLESFSFEGLWQQMEEQDVRWMVEAWPNLKIVVGEFTDGDGQNVWHHILCERNIVYFSSP